MHVLLCAHAHQPTTGRSTPAKPGRVTNGPVFMTPSPPVPTISLAAVDDRRSSRALQSAVEQALLGPGWFLVPLSDLEDGHSCIHDAYSAADAWSAEPEEARARCEQDAAAETGCLGLTYLPLGKEPLYQAKATQRVRSLNAHAPLSAEQCDALLPADMPADEREIAHQYHRWPTEPPASRAVRTASVALVQRLRERVCEPLFKLLEQLLGLGLGALARRCAMRRSDNTSLLRLLEYPPAASQEDGGGHGSGGECGSDGDGDGSWGVSEHTDFELFSLIHQASPGLQLRDRGGAWHTVAAAGYGEDAALVVLVGDMLERLSAGYFTATAHRVLATAAGAVSRRSLVYFVALDEEERISALPAASVRRGSGLAEWLEGLPEAKRRRYATPITQREWTEMQEGRAREQLADASSTGPAAGADDLDVLVS